MLRTRPGTDEEYVEFIRGQINHRTARIAFGVCSVLLLTLLFLLAIAVNVWLMSRIVKNARPRDELSSVIRGNFAGLMLCLGTYSAISALRCLRPPRAVQLMIRFHDRLEAKRHATTLEESNRPASPAAVLSDDERTKVLGRPPNGPAMRDEQVAMRKHQAWPLIIWLCLAVLCLALSLFLLTRCRADLDTLIHEGTWRGLPTHLGGALLLGLAAWALIGASYDAVLSHNQGKGTRVQGRLNRPAMTDEQYIMRMRKHQAWPSVIWSSLAALCLGLSLFALICDRVNSDTFADGGTWRGLAAGLGGALPLGVVALVLIRSIARLCVPYQGTERLMLKLHDEAMDIE